MKIQTTIKTTPNGLLVVLESPFCDRLLSLLTFLPPFLRRNYDTRVSTKTCARFFVPISDLNNDLPFGKEPAIFIQDAICIAQADYIFSQYCAY